MELDERCKSTSDTNKLGQRNFGVMSDRPDPLAKVWIECQATCNGARLHCQTHAPSSSTFELDRTDWLSVLFLDENHFNLTITDGRKWCWRLCYAPVTKSPDGHLGVVGVMWNSCQLA